MSVPNNPRIFHIVHVDRLASIVRDERLYSDAVLAERRDSGTVIGMSNIKARRLTSKVKCRSNLTVGQCVPFYFSPRSVMLYMIHKRNEELAYKGGQEPIVHLESGFLEGVEWAEKHGRQWAFTLSNAGSSYFEDRCRIDQLGEINWDSVRSNQWAGARKEGKQAEFLVERSFPWHLVSRIGIHSGSLATRVADAMKGADHRPVVEVKREWYY